MGQIIYREYRVFRSSNISCSLATATERERRPRLPSTSGATSSPPRLADASYFKLCVGLRTCVFTRHSAFEGEGARPLACMLVSVCVCTRDSAFLCVHICVHWRVCRCDCVCVCVCVCVFVVRQCFRVGACALWCICRPLCVCVCVCVCMCVCVCVCVKT